MDEGHKTRIALNEATYRNVNEAMRADGPEHAITFVCECARLGCNELIRLSRAEYERVRSNAQRFAIVPGHDVPGVEDVVERLRRLRGHREARRRRRRASSSRTRSGRANAEPEVERGARKRDGDPG